MGNQVGSCISCQNCVKTKKDLELDFSQPETSFGHNRSPVRGNYDNLVVIAKPRISYEDQLRKIVKIQSVWRGYQSRKKHPRSKKNHFKEEEIADFPADLVSTKREKRPRYTFRSGAVYEGEWLGNLRDGYGVQIWTDGARYEGEWRKNKAHGKGKFFHIDGDTYDGQWQDDKANGYGVYVHTNGARYEGQWNKDMQEGYGIEVWPDGSRYDGFYKGGKKHGHGLYKWGDGSKYTGEWQDNRIKGYGVYTWPDGRRYDGEWLANNMHGKGVHIWPDQRRYEGEYFNDKKDGYGVYLWADGRKYQGYWRDGKQHGIGKYITSNETKWGIWEEGKRTKWIDGLNDQDVFRFRDGSAVCDNYNDLNINESLKRARIDSYQLNRAISSKSENKNGVPAC